MNHIDIFKANLKRLEELAIMAVNKDQEVNETLFDENDEVFMALNKEYFTILADAEKLMISFQDDFVGGIDALRNTFESYQAKQHKRVQAQKDLEKAGFVGEKYRKCNRCKGTGLTGFTHVKGGICFGCTGTGKTFTAAYKKFMKMDDLPF